MDNANFHAQKKVLIEHVSDDIRAVNQSNVGQQKTLLTARAIADVFKGDAFDASRPTDAAYFTGDQVDLNKLTDACIRYIETNKYSNGPEFTNKGGFISVASVLPSGVLTWDSNDVATRGGSDVSVRQLFYPEDIDDLTAYTRVGVYSGGTWTFSRWLPLGGQLMRVKVTDSTKGALLTGASAKLRPNTIYELHCSVGEIVLPDANSFPTGTRVVFEQYPGEAVKDASGKVVTDTYKSMISYTEIDASGNSQKYATYAIPALDKIRTSAEDYRDSGAWFENSTGAVQYAFEVVDLEHEYTLPSGEVCNRTWLLDVDQDAIARTSDLAALIDAHTDQKLADVIRYASRTVATADKAKDLVISRQATFAGMFKLSISASDAASLTNGFGIKLYLVNESSDGIAADPSIYDWVEVARGADLNPTIRYYYNDVTGKKLLAGVGGYVENWDDINADTLFIKNYLGSSLETAAGGTVVSIATFTGTTSPVAKLNAEFSKAELVSMGKFEGYIRANRNTTLVAVISSNDHISDKAKITPEVTFNPDPHDTYIDKNNINTSALTTEQLNALAKQGSVKDMVVSADIVAKIYDLIVGNLQKQGLFFGPRPIPRDGSGNANFDAATDAGIYTVDAPAGWNGSTTLGTGVPPWFGSPCDMLASTAGGGANAFISNAQLHVIKSDVISPDAKLESEAVNTARYTRITQTLYGDFYRNSPAGETEGIANKASPLVCVRYGIWNGVGVTWSKWASLVNDVNPSVWCDVNTAGHVHYVKVSDTEYILQEASVVENMRERNRFVIDNDLAGSTSIKVTINMPPPRFEPGTRLVFDVHAGVSPVFKYTRTAGGVAEEYEYEGDEKVTAPDYVRYEFVCNQVNWYLITSR